MKILSLFDGISCARVALERRGIPVEIYYASEIDKYAIQISRKNWPDIVQVGSVVGLDTKQFKKIDLLIGGSPCQDLSIAKKDRKGLSGDRSGLFWEYVRILKLLKPKYFILENVNSMPKEAKDLITKTLGVEPIMIDAALVSAQRRKRLFWVGKLVYTKHDIFSEAHYEQVDVTLPDDRGILLKDILEDNNGVAITERRTEKAKKARSLYMKKTGKDFSPRRAKELVPRQDGKANTITTGVTKEMLVMKEKSNTIRLGGGGSKVGDKHEWDSVYQYRRTYWRETKGGKVPTLTANMGTGGNNIPYIVDTRQTTREKTPRIYDKGKSPTLNSTMYKEPYNVATDSPSIRKLTPLECERLQSLPDGYTDGVSNTQRYKALGNAFNAEVVAHILSFIV
jgi:DNA (cytosine-5)-methyltransferase 3A